MDGAHSLATTPGAGLEQKREPDPRRQLLQRVRARGQVVGFRKLAPGGHGHARVAHQPAGRHLVTHRFDRTRRRADPDDPGRLDHMGELSTL